MAKDTPAGVEEYMAQLSQRDRAALEQLRAVIRAAAPDATETISYQIPTFKQHGMLVAYSAHKNHYSLHAVSTDLMRTLQDELARYHTTKGSVRFPYGDPLPAAVVTRIVKARIQENEARHQEKQAVRTQKERK